MFDDINIWAVVLAALSAFVLGGIWYSKRLFGVVWMRESGREPSEKEKHPPRVFIIAFLLALIAAFMFALFLGPRPSFALAVSAGVITGLCWVSTSFGINYLFANRSLKLFLIDAGYHTLQFTLYGIIIGLWQ